MHMQNIANQEEPKPRRTNGTIIREKHVRIYRNGDQLGRECVKILLSQGITFNELTRLLIRRFSFNNFQRLRLFSDEGVEIFENELQYVRGAQILYASQGEEFDAASTFNVYKQLQVLGEGGFGRVILGEHRRTREKVAIKFLNTAQIGNAYDIDMVFKEADVLKSLQHKNIVQIFNCYTLPSMQVVYIMEYLEGGELLGYLEERGHLSENEARELFTQIMDAMSYCHRQKLIHRDLKLENIMLVKHDQRHIKVVDFGIAGSVNNFNLDKVNMGSLRYMAPEVLSNRIDKIGPGIDIWAMGVILYALVTGTMPFEGRTPNQIVENILAVEYQLPRNFAKSLSLDIKDLFKKVFKAEPRNRIGMQGLFQHKWVQGNLQGFGAQQGRTPNIKQQQVQIEEMLSSNEDQDYHSDMYQSEQKNMNNSNISATQNAHKQDLQLAAISGAKRENANNIGKSAAVPQVLVMGSKKQPQIVQNAIVYEQSYNSSTRDQQYLADKRGRSNSPPQSTFSKHFVYYQDWEKAQRQRWRIRTAREEAQAVEQQKLEFYRSSSAQRLRTGAQNEEEQHKVSSKKILSVKVRAYQAHNFTKFDYREVYKLADSIKAVRLPQPPPPVEVVEGVDNQRSMLKSQKMENSTIQAASMYQSKLPDKKMSIGIRMSVSKNLMLGSNFRTSLLHPRLQNQEEEKVDTYAADAIKKSQTSSRLGLIKQMSTSLSPKQPQQQVNVFF